MTPDQLTDGLLNLINLLLNLNGATIKQIPFPAQLPSASDPLQYVTADSTAERQAFKAFMRPTKAPAKPQAKAQPTPQHHAKTKHAPKPALDTAGLSGDAGDGVSQAKQLTKPRMPVFYPTLVNATASYCTNLIGNCENGYEPAEAYRHAYPRQYVIPNSSGKKVRAYRMTVELNGAYDEYYGIQGLHWKNPPLLSSPSGTMVVHGRKLFLYKDDGDHLTTVAFHVGDNSYWVSNTLDSKLPNNQMIAIAATMRRFKP